MSVHVWTRVTNAKGYDDPTEFHPKNKYMYEFVDTAIIHI